MALGVWGCMFGEEMRLPGLRQLSCPLGEELNVKMCFVGVAEDSAARKVRFSICKFVHFVV